MEPDMEDIQEMVTALYAVKSGMDHAQRQSPKAGQLSVLQVIAGKPGISPKAIAEELHLHPSSITRQVQVLAEAGYVMMDVNPEDRRSCHITLTDAGRDEMQRLTQIGLGRFALFVADWEAEEVRTLARLLRKFRESATEVTAQEQHTGGRRWQREL
jgi:DNA-binding MarR family transcriptional regulator